VIIDVSIQSRKNLGGAPTFILMLTLLSLRDAFPASRRIFAVEHCGNLA
jgi:hypothetical protein